MRKNNTPVVLLMLCMTILSGCIKKEHLEDTVIVAFLRAKDFDSTSYWSKLGNELTLQAQKQDKEIHVFYTKTLPGSTEQANIIDSVWNIYGDRIRKVIFASSGPEAEHSLSKHLNNQTKLGIIDSPLNNQSILKSSFSNVIATDNETAGLRMGLFAYTMNHVANKDKRVSIICDSTSNASLIRTSAIIRVLFDKNIHPNIIDIRHALPSCRFSAELFKDKNIILATTATASAACLNSGLIKSNGYYTFAFDDDDSILDAISEGEIQGTIVQDINRISGETIRRLFTTTPGKETLADAITILAK
ncbi:MAG: hypothetical protein MJY71_03640 [Bacteroidaceae bacterium]|nr:hypothetical protein [Bacteroidaceae bacterium]